MSAPRWALALLRRVAPPERVDDLLGDLEEAHRERVARRAVAGRRGRPRRRDRLVASAQTGLEALELVAALVRERIRGRRAGSRRESSDATVIGGGRKRPGISWLDVKLGVRMLVKYPGLTMVGGFAMAFAIWVGAGTFEFVTQLLHPRLPLPDGDRIVAIRNWDAAASRVERRALADFASWREALESVEELGAFRALERNLIAPGVAVGPVELAEISAAAFRVARVAPLLGRTLVEADESPRAPPVAVIGYEVWRTRFAGDPDIVGREVRLGDAVHTVVGVMPEGFAFPVRQGLWVPLRLDVGGYERRQGPSIRVFGRLAPGFSLAEAQAELDAFGVRAAAAFPDTHEHLRPQVVPYPRAFMRFSGLEYAGFMSANVLVAALLVLACGNVGLLMFARAATRESEIVVRTALGASRGRIIAQLFTEAFVLGAIASAVGLAAAGHGLKWWLGAVEGLIDLPFWIDDRLSPLTVFYAATLTLVGAAIAGVTPALKVTRRLGSRLRQTTAGGGGFRFGGVWTVAVAGQVAVAIAIPVLAFFVWRGSARIESIDVGFPAEQYLSVRLELGDESPLGPGDDASRAEFLARYGERSRELERRLEADAAVAGVTFAGRLPRMQHAQRLVAVDEGGAAPPDPRWPGYRVSIASVAPDYFDLLDAPILAGRGFHSGDLASEARVVIVNQSFVDRVLGGRNPIGRRVRYLNVEGGDETGEAATEPDPWYEVIGVVRDLGMAAEPYPWVAGFYHPVAPGGVHPLHMAVRVRGEPESFAPRLREIALAVNPALRLHELMPLDQVTRAELRFGAFWFWLLAGVTAMALLLSLAGIYAIMSFTVAQRTREIGIRVALGADRRRIVAAVFRRPLAQVALGVVAGGGLAGYLSFNVLDGAVWPRGVALLVAYSALMMGVCTLACVIPTRRALRIEPTEALRADG